jgi:pyruvate/2-oxoglutarate dehydrogenase complex dihydrolipoamide dehydrogenase (E3) component
VLLLRPHALEGAAVVIAVGSGAAMPSIPGLAEARPWTSRDATTTETIPARVIVLGGGVVRVEMAEACRPISPPR